MTRLAIAAALAGCATPRAGVPASLTNTAAAHAPGTLRVEAGVGEAAIPGLGVGDLVLLRSQVFLPAALSAGVAVSPIGWRGGGAFVRGHLTLRPGVHLAADLAGYYFSGSIEHVTWDEDVEGWERRVRAFFVEPAAALTLSPFPWLDASIGIGYLAGWQRASTVCGSAYGRSIPCHGVVDTDAPRFRRPQLWRGVAAVRLGHPQFALLLHAVCEPNRRPGVATDIRQQQCTLGLGAIVQAGQ